MRSTLSSTTNRREYALSITERDRHQLYLAVEGLIGAEDADTMMAMLPPVGWADVATKHDLAALESRLDLRFDATDLRFDGLVTKLDFEKELRSLSQRLMFAVVGSQISFMALMVTLLSFRG